MEGRFFLLMIYVDDILILADDSKLQKIEEFLKSEFTWITMVIDNKQSYLGMHQIALKLG
jgi:hypothetical protein